MANARVFATSRSTPGHGVTFDLRRIDDDATNGSDDSIRDITFAQLEWVAQRLCLHSDADNVLQQLRTVATDTTVEKWEEVKREI